MRAMLERIRLAADLERPCGQVGCGDPASTAMHWPGTPAAPVCATHAAKARGLATVMGFELVTGPLAERPAKPAARLDAVLFDLAFLLQNTRAVPGERGAVLESWGNVLRALGLPRADVDQLLELAGGAS